MAEEFGIKSSKKAEIVGPEKVLLNEFHQKKVF